MQYGPRANKSKELFFNPYTCKTWRIVAPKERIKVWDNYETVEKIEHKKDTTVEAPTGRPVG